jgi:predicted small secreted protein
MRPFATDCLKIQRPMRASLLSCTALLALSSLLAGCSTTRSCGGDTEYLQAVDRPPLNIPAEITPSERYSPLVIPPVASDPMRLDPEPRCLDEPPSFFQRAPTATAAQATAAAAAPGKPAGPPQNPAESLAQSWAAAWSRRDADGVLALYSETFELPGGTSAAAFLEQRREQVLSGLPPSATLEDLEVRYGADPDRPIVTFLQRFGENRVRRELLLAPEGDTLRIVSESTLGVL